MDPERQPMRTRRRRRKKNAEGTGSNNKRRTANWDLKEFCNDDDTPRFMTKEEDPVALPHRHKSTTSCCLLNLLRQRELGSGWNASRQEEWQSQMLIRPMKEQEKRLNSLSFIPRKEFRPYASRSVPFTSLQTPRNVAVLGIDRHGNYTYGMGYTQSGSAEDQTSTPQSPVLALHFYGIPSKAAFEGRVNVRSVAPLLQSVSLLSKAEADCQFISSMVSNDGSIDATVFMEPVTILTSSDSKIGAAFCLHNIPRKYRRESENATRQNGKNTSDSHNPFGGKDLQLGTLTVFSLPHGQDEQRYVQTIRFPNIRMGSFANAFTMRNLLWNVNTIPFHSGKKRQDCNLKETALCDSALEYPGYLLFNDEDDGFRMIWIKDSAWRIPNEDPRIEPLKNFFSVDKDPVTSNIVYGVDKAKTMRVHIPWKEAFNDRSTGERIEGTEGGEHSKQEGSLSIVFEAYFSIHNLLLSILSGRPNLRYLISDTGIQDYCYNLVSVNNDDRTVDVVAVMKNRGKVGSIGVIVKVDLFTQSYLEHSWMADKKSNSDTASARKAFCQQLTLTHRMRQRKLGPYSIDQDDKRRWFQLCQEKGFYSGTDIDMERDLDPAVWKLCMDLRAVEMIPYASLYADCEMASNAAISNVVPAAYLTGRRSPLKIVYR